MRSRTVKWSGGKDKAMKMSRDLTTRIAKRGVAVAAAVAVIGWGVAPADAWWRVGPPYWGYWPPVVVEPSLPPVVVQPSPPPVVVQPQAPQVYVAPEGAAHDSYYYYCESAKGYYPYVKDCPQGWTRVAPQPKAGG